MSTSDMFHIYHKTAPEYLCNMFSSNSHHKTRSQVDYLVPQVKTQGKKTFEFNGIKLWNQLTTNVRDIETIEVYKTKVKALLLDRMKEEMCDFIMLQNFILQHIEKGSGFSSLVFLCFFFLFHTFWPISQQPIDRISPNLIFEVTSSYEKMYQKMKVKSQGHRA